MVRKDHYVPGTEAGVERTGCVGEDGDFYAECLHDPHRKSDLFERVTLVIVVTPFQGDDGLTSQVSDHKNSFVGRDPGFGKAGDLGVRDPRLDLHFSGQAAQAGAKRDAKSRGEPGSRLDLPRSFIDSFF